MFLVTIPDIFAKVNLAQIPYLVSNGKLSQGTNFFYTLGHPSLGPFSGEGKLHVYVIRQRRILPRDIHYTGTNLSQLASLTSVSSRCEQFSKYGCSDSVLLWRYYSINPYGWWESRDSTKMTYWGGASINGKCACGMSKSCADPRCGCNFDKNDRVWRDKSGLLTDKTKLTVKQLRFGDAGGGGQQGYYTLGKGTA